MGGNMTNVCLLKVANPSGAGPFGGVIAFQMVGSNGAAPAAAPAAAATAPQAASGAGAGLQAKRDEVSREEKRGVAFAA